MGVFFAAKLRRGSTHTCSAAWSRCARSISEYRKRSPQNAAMPLVAGEDVRTPLGAFRVVFGIGHFNNQSLPEIDAIGPESLDLGDRLARLRRLASPASYALRVDVERIDRVARRHEQPVAVAAAEADVGGALGQRYEADRLAG